MVVDTSALIEVFLDGSEAGAVKAAIKPSRGHRFMSAASYLEAHIVVRRRFESAQTQSRRLLDELIARYGIAIEGVQDAHARLAVEAYYRFGKGGGSGALNYGDCFSYALAMQRNDVLLFIGKDFHQTDIRPALA